MENILIGMRRCTQDTARLSEINELLKSVRNYAGFIGKPDCDYGWIRTFIYYTRSRLISLQFNPGATSAGKQIDA